MAQKLFIEKLVFSALLGLSLISLIASQALAAPGDTPPPNKDENEIQIYDKKGTERKPYSIKYNSEKAVFEDGACQFVAKPGAALTVTPLMDGTYKVKGAKGESMPVDKTVPPTDKSQRAGQMEVVPEQIWYPEDPFWPRSEKDWLDRISPSLPYAEEAGDTGGAKKYNYTYVCGHKLFPLNWSNACAPNPKLQAWKDHFGWYKIPVYDHPGLVLVNDTDKVAVKAEGKRHSRFRSAFPQCWEQYYQCCLDALGPYFTAYCKIVAVQSCEYKLCNEIILPSVTPGNYLKFAYNTASGGGKVPTIMAAPRKPWPPSNGSGDSPVKYTTQGLGWFFANPKKLFGYNMPPLKFWPTGLPADASVVKGVKNKEEWTPQNTVVVGPNHWALPDGSNDAAGEAHDKSAIFGGWNELKDYYAQCMYLFGLTCLCDYEKNFFPGTDIAYALRRAGSFVSDNMPVMKNKEIKISGGEDKNGARDPLGNVFQDLSAVYATVKDVPISVKGSQGKYFRIAPYVGGMMEDGTPWPGKIQGLEDLNGLGKARKNDIVVIRGGKTESKDVKYRPDQVWYVEDVIDWSGDENSENNDHCLRISTIHGANLNSAAVPESGGYPVTRTVCPPESAKEGEDGGYIGSPWWDIFNITDYQSAEDKSPPCLYSFVEKCVEDDWKDTERIAIYRANKDFRCFDYKTGKQC